MKYILTLLSFVLLQHFTYSQTGSQEFTASGSFTVPDAVTAITIEVVGAGGDGGYNGSGGGGGGGYAKGTYTVAPGDVLAITIGIHGAGSASGTTMAGSLVSASGGENGYIVFNPDIGGGGAAGMGMGGNISNYSGGTGGGGYYTYFGGGGGGAAGANGNGSNGGNTIVWNGSNCNTPGGDGGLSGGLPGGDGGKGAGFTDNYCIAPNPSAAGVNYGGGGGGGNGNGGGPATGANGYCLIYWCNIDNTIAFTENAASAMQEGATYQWIDCANGYAVLPGDTNQVFAATQSGIYAVIISDGPCSDTSDCVNLIGTGIANANSVPWQLDQNPFTDRIVIRFVHGNEYYSLTNSVGTNDLERKKD
jgi:hypothetical protein